jgi:hypothetical protein
MAALEYAAQLLYGQLQVLVYHTCKGWRSANKFRKLQTQISVLKEFVGFAPSANVALWGFAIFGPNIFW